MQSQEEVFKASSQTMGRIVVARKAENSNRKMFVRQLLAFHVLDFKYLLPDVEAVKLATRSSWLACV